MKKDKEKKQDEKTEFDFGIGKLNLGGIFSGLEKLIDLAGELKKAGGEIKKEGEIDLSNLKKGMKGVFGFSIKSMAGDESSSSGGIKVERFGHRIKKTPKGPKVEDEREPITDVFDEKSEIVIVAEMPGVNEESISLDLKEDILVIKAVNKDKKYYKEVLLPAKVSSETISSGYKNGILEIKIKKC